MQGGAAWISQIGCEACPGVGTGVETIRTRLSNDAIDGAALPRLIPDELKGYRLHAGRPLSQGTPAGRRNSSAGIQWPHFNNATADVHSQPPQRPVTLAAAVGRAPPMSAAVNSSDGGRKALRSGPIGNS
jgi:hypothetical protein